MGSISNLLLLEKQAVKKQHGGNMRHAQSVVKLTTLLLPGIWVFKTYVVQSFCEVLPSCLVLCLPMYCCIGCHQLLQIPQEWTLLFTMQTSWSFLQESNFPLLRLLAGFCAERAKSSVRKTQTSCFWSHEWLPKEQSHGNGPVFCSSILKINPGS